MKHQYIARDASVVVTEELFADRFVRWVYAAVRENSRFLFNALTSGRTSSLLGYINYDAPRTSVRKMIRALHIDLSECLDPPVRLDHPRKIFERKIRYRQCRPLASGSCRFRP